MTPTLSLPTQKRGRGRCGARLRNSLPAEFEMCACPSACAETNGEEAPPTSCAPYNGSPADCLLRLAEDLGRKGGEPLEQRIDLLRRRRINVEAGPPRLGQEFGILQRGGER